MTNNHKYNEEKVRYESILICAHIVVHNLLPVLTDEAYKDRYKTVFKGVEILGGWQSIRIIFIDDHIILVKVNVIVE